MFLLNGKTTDNLLKQAYELTNIPDTRELDVLLSSGEQISISKLCILLKSLGYDAISLTGWQAGIYTNGPNQKSIINNIDTSRILNELSNKKIVVIAGFQGINNNFDITTLGRGGSDTTAVAISAALKAKQCFIFSDVDGIYTTDPNKFPDAKKIPNLSYTEMIDIATEGAKVLHNRCVEIGEKFNIPIIAKSTFNNEFGSIINEKIEESVVKSIVKNDDILKINLKPNSNFRNNFVDLIDLQNFMILNNIIPIEISKNICSYSVNNILNNKCIYEYTILIKNSDINLFKKMSNTNLSMYDVTISKISRISIIGYGITSDYKIINTILKTINNFDINLSYITFTDTKIIFTFNNLIDNELLTEIHRNLF